MNVAHMSRTAGAALAAALFATPVLAQLPSGAELHARYVAASGGAENIKKHTSMHMTAEFEIPAQGMKGSVEAWGLAPDKFLSVVEIPGLGTIKQGFDGTTGWGVNPMTGATVLTGKELAQMKEQADMHAVLNPNKFTKSRETLEKTTFDGKEAYKVKAVPVEGEDFIEYYDAKTGLMIGTVRKIESQMGPMESTNIVTEYQLIDGQMMPMKMKQSVMGMDQVITIKKVEFVPVDAAVFELPKEIKALVK